MPSETSRGARAGAVGSWGEPYQKAPESVRAEQQGRRLRPIGGSDEAVVEISTLPEAIVWVR